MMIHQANVLDSVQPTLPPRIWQHPDSPEPTLRPVHAHFITSHIYKVLEHGGYANPHKWLKLYMTGSLCTYQYSDTSDADVSLFVDATRLPEWSRAEMIGLMIEGTDGVLLPGTPYELQAYVVGKHLHPADLFKPGLRAGYSIATHRWVTPPDHRLTHDTEAQENGFYVWALQAADKMERLLRYEPDKAVDYWHQIHRKRIRDQSMGKGDVSESNILYKFLNKRNLLPAIAQVSGEHIANLQGLPGPVNVPGYGQMQFGTNPDIERVANEYNQANGLGAHPTDYVPVNPQTGAQIAQAYAQMPHSPNDPQVKAAYDALARETRQQYDHAVNNGYQFEFYPQGQDPYPNSPREAVMDLANNKHMYVYPTAVGYGDNQQGMDHPLLGDSGVRWNNQPVTHNDLFRAIHDFYGHAKEGLGFRHHGEDNAYRQHAAMFSPPAQQALASETRGQNSWVNFGPFGQTNQNANQQNTVYAPQKAGLLPEWVSNPDLHKQVVSKVAASQIANTAYQATLQSGGVTISLDGQQPTTGYAFPPSKSEEMIVPVDKLSPATIDHFITDRYRELQQPGHYLGTWIDGNQVYLDVSIVEPDYNKAYDTASGSNQLAIYNLDKGEDVPLRSDIMAA